MKRCVIVGMVLGISSPALPEKKRAHNYSNFGILGMSFSFNLLRINKKLSIDIICSWRLQIVDKTFPEKL